MEEQDLTLVGLTEDRQKLVLVSAAGAEFTLPAYARLRAAQRGPEPGVSRKRELGTGSTDEHQLLPVLGQPHECEVLLLHRLRFSSGSSCSDPTCSGA